MRSEIIAAQARVWGPDAQQLCARCENDAEPFSCYCFECEAEIDEDELARTKRPETE